MELLCGEPPVDKVCKACADPNLLNDERVLQNLLDTENRYIPSSSYFLCVQTEITPKMRHIVSQWMLEVCEERRCQEDVFPLAMNYVDRFLSVCCIKKSQLQLLGAACLFLSSKLRESCPISAFVLIHATDNSITLDELMGWELLVLARLKWDLSAVIANDFLDYILQRLPFHLVLDREMTRRHCQTFIALCSTEFKFSMCPASMLASGSIAAAIQGLRHEQRPDQTQELVESLHHITSIDMDLLRSCLDQIEETLQAEVRRMRGSGTSTSSETSTSAVTSNEKLGEHQGAGTPTDVHDVHF